MRALACYTHTALSIKYKYEHYTILQFAGGSGSKLTIFYIIAREVIQNSAYSNIVRDHL